MMMKTMRLLLPARTQTGFTLVEVLIALAIISVALAAFVRTTSQATGNLGGLEQRSLAMLSAENAIALTQLGTPQAPGVQIIDCPQADQAFVCRVQIGPVQQGMRAVTAEVYVGRNSSQRLASVQTQLAEPLR